MKTDVFNHGPAKLFVQTGSPQPGRPSMGAWATYGIGSAANNLPGFVVLQSGPRGPRAGSALWSSGFLPTTYQGVPFRGQGDPILNLESPAGFGRAGQRAFTDAVNDLNRLRLEAVGDPEIETRIAAYEMAYKMQLSAPELMDVSFESKSTIDMYGIEEGKPSFARNALLARRLVERGVRFVQLYHTSWDQHGGGESLEKELPLRCKQVDQGTAALIKDLKQRGMLEDTLVVWGGEFGAHRWASDANQPAATITRMRSPCGSPAAVRNPAYRSVRRTTLACPSPTVRCTCTICRRRSSICSGSTTSGLHIARKVATSG